jgi:hypothetical protein
MPVRFTRRTGPIPSISRVVVWLLPTICLSSG